MIKTITSLLFLLVTTLSVHAQQKKGAKTYVYSQMGGLCTSGFALYPNGRFFYEHGCEASSGFTSGTYEKIKDTIFFTPEDYRNIPVIREVNASRTSEDSVSFIVLDKNDINITDRIRAALWLPKAGVIYQFKESYQEPPVTIKKQQKRESSFLTLITLNKMYGRSFDYSTDTVKHFVIKLHIPQEEIFRSNREDTPPFSMLQRGDTLHEIPDHPLAGKYVLEKE